MENLNGLFARDYADKTCEILTGIGDAQCEILKNAGDIAHRDSNHLASVERDLQNQIHASRQILTQLIADKTDRIIDLTSRDLLDTKNQLRHFEVSTNEKFCETKSLIGDSERRIMDRLTADKLDEKQDLIDCLRQDRANDRFASILNAQNQELNYMKQSINSVEQNQRFSSKTTVFGSGNSTGTSQTANQG